MALTGKVAPYKKGFGPFPAEVYHAPFPKAYHGIDTAKRPGGCVELFLNDVDPSRVAACHRRAGAGGGRLLHDEFYDQAVAIVCDTRQASVSYIQRRLQIGYNRAARMVEQMERDGIVGPTNGAKPRDVLAPRRRIPGGGRG